MLLAVQESFAYSVPWKFGYSHILIPAWMYSHLLCNLHLTNLHVIDQWEWHALGSQFWICHLYSSIEVGWPITYFKDVTVVVVWGHESPSLQGKQVNPSLNDHHFLLLLYNTGSPFLESPHRLSPTTRENLKLLPKGVTTCKGHKI